MREERRLRVLEYRVLRRIFGPKRDEVTEEWGKLHNEELNDLYCSPIIFRMTKWRRMRWEGYVARMGEGRGLYRVLVAKLEVKRLRRRRENNIKMDLRNWDMEHRLDRVAGTCECGNEPSGSIKCGEMLD